MSEELELELELRRLDKLWCNYKTHLKYCPNEITKQEKQGFIIFDYIDKLRVKFAETQQKVKQLEEENNQLKDNWNKLKDYLINDINDRNGHTVVEYEDDERVSKTISPIYTLMEDKSKIMKEVLDKMQELERGKE